jgi:hypothetical protein
MLSDRVVRLFTCMNLESLRVWMVVNTAPLKLCSPDGEGLHMYHLAV